jgi:hypothetical protein
MLDRRRWRLPDADPATVFCVDWHLRSSFSLGIGCRQPHCAATLPAPHRQNTAPKSQPPNPRGEIFRHRVEETTGKNVSAAKKIACDPKKVPAIRAKFDNAKRQLLLIYQLLSRWLGCRDSNPGMAELELPSRVCERGLSNDGAISAMRTHLS